MFSKSGAPLGCTNDTTIFLSMLTIQVGGEAMTNDSLEASTLTAVDHAAGLAEYAAAGSSRAQSLGNRGPLRLTDTGDLHPQILAAYWHHGFYVFEGLVQPEEIAELRDDVDYLLQRAPTGQGAVHDAQGRPAFGQQMSRSPYVFIKPLSDHLWWHACLGRSPSHQDVAART